MHVLTALLVGTLEYHMDCKDTCASAGITARNGQTAAHC